MRAVVVNYVYGAFEEPKALLERYESLTGWAAGLAQAGVEVVVLQRFGRDATVERGGIRYEFVADRHAPHPKLWQLPIRLHQRARALRPTVLHLNGLLFPLQVAMARAMHPRAALVVQHHAGRPMRGWRRQLQRAGLRGADGFLFAARALAAPWLAAGVIPSPNRVFEVMEGSTWFTAQPRAEARQRSGLHGEPLFLWVGRLDQNKDPLTVLQGFRGLLAQVPGARLAMLYGSEELLPSVLSCLDGDATLKRAVRLVGQVPHQEMVAYYSSADYFVLGSHEEGSGYALAEALACGVVPLVTNIPSFHMMTANGTLGALWAVGNAEAMTRAGLALLSQPHATHAAAARRFFEERLSYPAIGQEARAIYETVVARRGQRL